MLFIDIICGSVGWKWRSRFNLLRGCGVFVFRLSMKLPNFVIVVAITSMLVD